MLVCFYTESAADIWLPARREKDRGKLEIWKRMSKRDMWRLRVYSYVELEMNDNELNAALTILPLLLFTHAHCAFYCRRDVCRSSVRSQ